MVVKMVRMDVDDYINQQKSIEDSTRYDELYCQICGERTSHVEIDTIDGKMWQCEICGEKRK
jgi:ribosomal protein L37AE/L43A